MLARMHYAGEQMQKGTESLMVSAYLHATTKPVVPVIQVHDGEML